VSELPDVTVYVEALTPRIVGQRVHRVGLRSPFVLRSVEPPIEQAAGRLVGASAASVNGSSSISTRTSSSSCT
jgi:hypothetical protein